MKEHIIGFQELQVGQRVKVKGKHEPKGVFQAIEIAVKMPKDLAELEGLIDDIDYDRRTVRLFGREYQVPHDVKVKNLDGEVVDFHDLQPGQMVKLKGIYRPHRGMLIEKINMKETFGFVIDELQGIIQEKDEQNNCLIINGFQVMVSAKTLIEGY